MASVVYRTGGKEETGSCAVCAGEGWTAYRMEKLDGEPEEAFELCAACKGRPVSSPEMPEDSFVSEETAARIERGVRLFMERSGEFERVAPFTWLVPTCSGREHYTVDLRHGYCSCADWQIRRARKGREPSPCKHVFAAEMASAKRNSAIRRGKRTA